MHTDSVLDAQEQALWARQPERGRTNHYCDCGAQYVSTHYSVRLAEAGIELSVGSTIATAGNALAGAINGLEVATLAWVS